MLIAARQRALIELDPAGAIVRSLKIGNPDRHPQMEGVEITAGGALIVADEGAGGRARLGIYHADG